MSDENKDIKRWTAPRKAEVVTEIIKGKTTASEVARTHDLTIGEIEQWKSDFIDMGPRLYAPIPVMRRPNTKPKRLFPALIAKIPVIPSPRSSKPTKSLRLRARSAEND